MMSEVMLPAMKVRNEEEEEVEESRASKSMAEVML